MNLTPVRIAGEPLTMSTRDIAELCETRHNQIIETVERLFAKGVLRESRKTTRTHSPGGGGRPTEVYDLTKRDTLVVASGYDDALRARIIDRWMEIEARDRPDPLAMLSDPAAMRHLLLGYADRVIELQGEIDAARPQQEALRRIAQADGSLCITDAAKTLQVQPKQLFAHLRSQRWIYTRTGSHSDIGYQDKIAAGFLEHKVTAVPRPDGTERTVTQVRVTAKGLARLAVELPERSAR